MAPRRRLPPAVAFDDVVYRWSDYDTPLWARPNTTAQRWNRTREGPTQYASLAPEGAWAELIRAEDLTTVAEIQVVHMPLWILRVRETRVADYATLEQAEAAGFSPDALVDDDHERCRAEGTRLREHGFRGVLAPSAALPGTVNLTLFGARLAVEWDCREERRLGSFVPARQLAVGRPPDDLLPRVRQHGRPHAGLAAHRAGGAGRSRR
jgi:RES domain-containing protein